MGNVIDSLGKSFLNEEENVMAFYGSVVIIQNVF